MSESVLDQLMCGVVVGECVVWVWVCVCVGGVAETPRVCDSPRSGRRGVT